MLVVCYKIVDIAGKCTIRKFVVIFVRVNQVEMVVDICFFNIGEQ